MKGVVVYESFFGNTEQIALKIASVLGIEAIKANQVQLKQLEGVDLIIVGSPTRGFQASPDTKAFLKSIPSGMLSGKKVAAFDTRLNADAIAKSPGFLRFLIGIFGYAAEPIDKALVRKGGIQALPPEGFFVPASEGPLVEGELERAEQWASKLQKQDG
jgi:flavodoxin